MLVVLLLLPLHLTAVRCWVHEQDTKPCPGHVRREPATSVWDLKPSQVDVVMALGDSITAAFGAEGKRGGLHEYRGKSWSIGGDANATTLPNFIRLHNPDLTGYSVGKREGSLCWGGVCLNRHVPRHDRLNGALSGAMISNVVKEEVEYLIQQLEVEGVDIENTWKVLTLFIGANDVCVACHARRKMDATEWESNLRITLDTIRDRVPKVLVNLVEVFNVSKIYDATENDAYCRVVHQFVFVECACAFGPEASHYRARMDQLALLYNRKTREVAKDYMAIKNDTFAIALHTFTRDMDITTFPREMISDLDCFHPSEPSHAVSATALWNSMLTPPNKRATNVDLYSSPLCADEDAIFYPGLPEF